VSARATALAQLLLWLALLAGAGCDQGSSSGPAPSRVVAVAQNKAQVSESELCDVLKPGPGAPTFVYPELMAAAPKSAAAGYRWINVWATWCPPCTEELPLLGRFRDALQKQGVAVELALLSVDHDADLLSKFAEKHPEVRGSLQVKDAAALTEWLPKVGLDSGATLPIHLFVDAQNKVRCARTGALRESDLPLVKKLLSGS
jgi:thiol-disulfide isomerase/thioredoxin